MMTDGGERGSLKERKQAREPGGVSRWEAIWAYSCWDSAAGGEQLIHNPLLSRRVCVCVSLSLPLSLSVPLFLVGHLARILLFRQRQTRDRVSMPVRWRSICSGRVSVSACACMCVFWACLCFYKGCMLARFPDSSLVWWISLLATRSQVVLAAEEKRIKGIIKATPVGGGGGSCLEDVIFSSVGRLQMQQKAAGFFSRGRKINK